MRNSYWLITALLVANVWAKSANPWVFFVKFNDTYEPLSATYSTNDDVTVSVLTHGDLYPVPYEVDLRRGYVYSDDETYPEQVGWEGGLLTASPQTRNSYFNLDFQMRVINGPFQSCEVFNGPVRGIVYKDTKYPVKNCMDVELFLLSYDRKKKWASKMSVPEKEKNNVSKQKVSKQKVNTGSEETEKNGSKEAGVVVTTKGGNTEPKEYGKEANEEEKRETSKKLHIASYNDLEKTAYSLASLPTSPPSSSSKYPLVFFAEINEKLEPLSGLYFGDNHGNMSLFSYGNTSTEPVEFNLKDNFIYTTTPGSSGYAGFNKEASDLVFGPTVPCTTLSFDSKGKLLNGPFYSCPKSQNGVFAIVHQPQESVKDSCTEANIFVLPYDRTTKSAIIEKPNVNEELESEYEFHLLNED